ncbi:MAG TPA: ADP-forming succinate--CoA ligase subunit beta [Chthonomonadales bacterium]|nr:ADP-forming succinate--CoA ligase subunit beta [Chthonomonadales bacterium]
MKVHEYQAKELLRRFGVEVPDNQGVADTGPGTRDAVERMGGKAALKAQVHTGGRGKAGGIRLASSPEEAEKLAGEMLGMLLKTHQAPDGLRVDKLLVEEPIDIRQEYYFAAVPDRAMQRDTLIVSAKGGMDIEAVAAEDPGAITKVAVHPLEGLGDFQVRQALYDAGIDPAHVEKASLLLKRLYEAYVSLDASLVEINPVAVTGDGRILAADAKIEIDDSALFRHPDLAAVSEGSQEDPIEAEAKKEDIAYVRLDGEIGIICNGAGLTMTTMDEVKRAGGSPANFLDVGGGAQAARVRKCLQLVLSDPHVKGILINIFGGITRCDEVAGGILDAISGISIGLPIVVRLAGTRAAEGAEILSESSLTYASTMQEAAERIVALAAT